MDEHVWIGIDVGTQGVRARAVTDDGTTIAVATANLTSIRDGRSHRQDPATWASAAAQTIRTVKTKLGSRPVHGVAVDATSGTITIVDEHGTPTGPGLMYDDATAAAHTAAVRDAGADVWAAHGYRIGPTWALVKITDLADTGALRPGSYIAHQSDVVTSWLTGYRTATDASNALKSGYDQLRQRWPTDVLSRLGIDTEQLPAVVRPGSLLGEVGKLAASATGLPAGTPIVAGMSDGCASHLGAGSLTTGRFVISLGTTMTIKGVQDHLVTDNSGVLYSHPAPLSGDWLLGGASSCGASVLSELLPGYDLALLTQTVIQDHTLPLPCYPLLGAGERFPWAAPGARGFIGHDRTPLDAAAVDTYGPAVVMASVTHALAHLERACLDAITAAGGTVDGPVTFTGGTTANTWWNQLRCDILGRQVRVPTAGDAALGMAALARIGVSGEDAPAVIEQMAARAMVHDPTGHRHDDAYAQFIDLAPKGGSGA